MIWKKKSEILMINKLYIKQSCLILKRAEKIQKENSKVARTKNGIIILLSFYQNVKVCDSKKFKFIKEKEASGLLSSLRIKTLLNKIPLLGPLLF